MRSRFVRLGGLVLMCLALPLLVFAQGSFYREVEKDGRIYVFNNMRQYQAWEQSGEMGVGLGDGCGRGSPGRSCLKL